MKKRVLILGGGAAGFFAAIAIAQAGGPHVEVHLLEQSQDVLNKVRISGGGRCNVTHACFDPKQLIKHYPRGSRALLGPFMRFQPQDTIQWFSQRGVELKEEQDGRIFPVSDQSQTIIDCLLQQSQQAGVFIHRRHAVMSIEPTLPSCFNCRWTVALRSGERYMCHDLLLATGSNRLAHQWLMQLQHTVVPAVPSLFTFNLSDERLAELEGITMPSTTVSLLNLPHKQSGPLLITHWGVSGPAILRLSAFAARELHHREYRAGLQINWLADLPQAEVLQALGQSKRTYAARYIVNDVDLPIAKKLWRKLVLASGIQEQQRWSTLSKVQEKALLLQLTQGQFQIEGKSLYKQEFVTAGGVALDEVNFKTMESRLHPGLYFAGEILDIDGVTGGFNFQNAWTTAWIAAQAIVAQGALATTSLQG